MLVVLKNHLFLRKLYQKYNLQFAFILICKPLLVLDRTSPLKCITVDGKTPVFTYFSVSLDIHVHAEMMFKLERPQQDVTCRVGYSSFGNIALFTSTHKIVKKRITVTATLNTKKLFST